MAGALLHKNVLQGLIPTAVTAESVEFPAINAVDGRPDTIGQFENATFNFTATDIDCVAIYGHNFGSANLAAGGFIILRSGGAFVRLIQIDKEASQAVFVKFDTETAIDEIFISHPLVASGDRFFGLVAAGLCLPLGPDCDSFALRTPFSPPGVYQTLGTERNISNNNLPLPQSYVVKSFDVSLDFKFVDPDIMHAELAAGLYQNLQTEISFICWDIDNHTSLDTYPQVAMCWAERTINPPRYPDYNRLYDWQVKLKGRSE